MFVILYYSERFRIRNYPRLSLNGPLAKQNTKREGGNTYSIFFQVIAATNRVDILDPALLRSGMCLYFNELNKIMRLWQHVRRFPRSNLYSNSYIEHFGFQVALIERSSFPIPMRKLGLGFCKFTRGK